MESLTITEFINFKSDTQGIEISIHAVYCAIREDRLQSFQKGGQKHIILNQNALNYAPQIRHSKLKKDSEGMLIMPNGVAYRNEEWWKG